MYTATHRRHCPPHEPKNSNNLPHAVLASACSSGPEVSDAAFDNLMDIDVCDPRSARFTTDIDNPFLPLPVGHRIVLEGEVVQ